jgi:hypothetical protein
MKKNKIKLAFYYMFKTNVYFMNYFRNLLTRVLCLSICFPVYARIGAQSHSATNILNQKNVLDKKDDFHYTADSLPAVFSSGKQGTLHVQGIAVDKVHGFIYFSFTDKLVKMDLSGNIVGSVTGLVGHLGDLAFDPETNTIYGSLEYKDDAVGKGISKILGLKNSNAINFYIAVFDGSRIVRPGMDAGDAGVLKTVYLKEVVDDYKAEVREGDRIVAHRFGCSGIDGVALGPSIGNKNDPAKYLYVAYGIYGDTTRNDNDHQVILKYSINNFTKTGQKLMQEKPHHSGPEKPLAKYFVKTGNTSYGIQNLAYDSYTGNFFAAVYKGSKSRFPNYSLFVIDGHKKPGNVKITSDNKTMKVKSLSLLQAGLGSAETGIRGWNFEWGSTGLFSLGDGFFYISHHKKTNDGQQATTIYKYKWVGNADQAFVLED